MRRDDPGLSWRSLHPMTSALVRGHREEKEQGTMEQRTMGAGNHGSKEP